MAVNSEKVFNPGTAEIQVNPDMSSLASRHSKSILARTRDFNSLISIKQLLESAGIRDVSIQYVGGFNLLLAFGNELDAKNFLSSNQVWNEWFSHADPWIGQALAFERVAWLRVLGIPLHLFCNEVVLYVCSRYGTVAKPPQILDDDCDLSMVSVGVLVGEGKRISEEVVLRWQDKKYRVWVSENLGDWLPDCLDVDFESDAPVEEASNSGSGEMLSPEFPVNSPAVVEVEEVEPRRENVDGHAETESFLGRAPTSGPYIVEAPMQVGNKELNDGFFENGGEFPGGFFNSYNTEVFFGRWGQG
ncbi:hypothetical protein Hdeb2414_s0011g00361891 [Helianthus debilis subsp. tardiflorus]